MLEMLFLGIIVFLVCLVVYIVERPTRRNAGDVLYFLPLIAIASLFMIGILREDLWDEIVVALGYAAGGSGIAAVALFTVQKFTAKS